MGIEAAIAGFLGAKIFGVTVSAWITVGSLITTGIQLVRLAFQRDPEPIDQLSGPKATIRSEVSNERYVLGRARVPGVLAYYGSYQRNAVMGLVLSEGECDSIEKVWIDGHEVLLTRTTQSGGDKLVPVAGNEYSGKIEFFEYFAADGTQGAFLRGIPSNANIDSGPDIPTSGFNYVDGYSPNDPSVEEFADYPGFWGPDGEITPATSHRLHFPNVKGTDGVVSPFRTQFPPWTVSHKLNGLSWVAVQLIQPEYGQDISNRFWSRVPNLEFLVKGKKLTWPGQTTPTWTQNAAAIRYWWEINRRGRDPEQIDETDFTAAYNLCEEDVTVTLPQEYSDAGFNSTSKRYSVNGVISSGDSVSGVEEQLDLAWAGQVLESRGTIHFRPGVQDSAACAVITDTDIVESPKVQPWAPLQERINAATAEIGQSFAHEYTRLTLPEFVDSSAETRDGEKRSGRMVLGFVNDPIAAVRLQVINLRRARESLRLVLVVRPGSDPSSSNPATHFDRLGLIPTDCVLVSNSELGLSNFRMVVEQVVIRRDWGVQLTLREDLTDTYDDTLTLPPLSSRIIRLAQDTDFIPDVQNLTVDEIASIAKDGTTLIHLLVSWTAAAVGQTLIEIRQKSSDPDNPDMYPWEPGVSNTNMFSFPGVTSGLTYEVRARHQGTNNVNGAWSNIVERMVGGDLTPPADPMDFDVDFRALGFRASWTNPNDNDLGSVCIYVAEGEMAAFGDSDLVATVSVSPGTTADPSMDSYEHSNLTAGTIYRVWIRAKDLSGNLSGTVGPINVMPVALLGGGEWHHGTGDPTPSDPANASTGDYYIDTNSGRLWQLGESQWVDTGIDLTPMGERLHIVESCDLPPDTLGVNGDIAVSVSDTCPGKTWKKESGSWMEHGSFQGEKGGPGRERG